MGKRLVLKCPGGNEWTDVRKERVAVGDPNLSMPTLCVLSLYKWYTVSVRSVR